MPPNDSAPEVTDCRGDGPPVLTGSVLWLAERDAARKEVDGLRSLIRRLIARDAFDRPKAVEAALELFPELREAREEKPDSYAQAREQIEVSVAETRKWRLTDEEVAEMMS